MRRRHLSRIISLFGSVGCIALLATPISPAQAQDEGWRAPPRAARTANPIKTDADSVSAGQKLWKAECAACHGDLGKGDGPQAKRLETKIPAISSISQQSDGELFWKVTTGRRPMPGYRKTLKDDQRWQGRPPKRPSLRRGQRHPGQGL
jgi:mono/diheme cytochrome c family protein